MDFKIYKPIDLGAAQTQTQHHLLKTREEDDVSSLTHPYRRPSDAADGLWGGTHDGQAEPSTIDSDHPRMPSHFKRSRMLNSTLVH